MGNMIDFNMLHGMQLDRTKQDLECKECGLCCCYFDVNLFDSDLFNIASELTDYSFNSSKPNMLGTGCGLCRETNTTNNKCVCLSGEQMRDCKCVIYNNKPKVCNDFNSGSYMCKFVRDFYQIDGIGL